jgi:excisionase family DNA binding protein
MAALVDQKEAARLLGVSEDELTAMIGRNEIFGYRDGPNWKFKMQELERVAEERGAALGAEPRGTGGSGIDADLEQMHPVETGDEGESILVSEEELGQSGIGAASTIIGKEQVHPDESDVKVSGSKTKHGAGASDVLSKSGSGVLSGGSGKGSDVELSPSGNGSDVALVAGGSDKLSIDDDVELEMDVSASSSDTGELAADSLALDDDLMDSADSLALDSGSGALSLDDDYGDESPTQLGPKGSPLAGDDDDDDVALASSVMLGGSDVKKTASDTGSALSLGEDDELVLGSGAGSDVTLGAGDSGIGLANPTDSGLSLEVEPVELGGSQVGSMALGEDDMIELEEDADPEAATQLKADDDFLLTPVDDEAEEESDSGSQVIALDTEQFDETSATLLAAGPAVLEEDEFGAAPAGMIGAGAPGMMMNQPMLQQSLPEAKYSIWNVLSLMVVVGLLIITGMMMVDLVQNMWAFDEPMAVNRPLMEFVLSLLGE